MRLAIVILSILFISIPVYSQIPYDNVPGWYSIEDDLFGTGAAVDDINGDGFYDLAVSNGNDMLQAENLAYINSNGFMPTSATWSSNDIAYSGHCDFGDYDSDGFPELAVSDYIGPDWGPGLIKIYDNIDGQLSNSPTWTSADSIYSFRLAWGDADNDGDLDLAVATGEAYNEYYRQNLIFYNDNGIISTIPGWFSADSNASYDVHWVDIDNDNDLDLAFCESGGYVKIYYNFGDSIATDAGWQCDEFDNYNSMDFADYDNDGYIDLTVAANIQLDGSGYFKIFKNISGTLHTTPIWQSGTTGFGSEAAFSDLNRDGLVELICGRWWGRVYIYENNNGSFNTIPDWENEAQYESVVENIVFSDFNNAGERKYKYIIEGPHNGITYLPFRQIAGIDSIRIDGQIEDNQFYCFGLWDGWVSTSTSVIDSLEIFYRFSTTQDMAVSNWDRESYIFYNAYRPYIIGDANDNGVFNGLDVVFLVTYFKGNGPPPALRLSGDVNGSCHVNGLDVTYMVAYFKGGPEPIPVNCD
jgi:hypothetical protein